MATPPDRVSTCPFCPPHLQQEQIVLQNEHCLFLQQEERVLIGSGIIVPRRHCESPFDLTEDEWMATGHLLREAKRLLDSRYAPRGYNVGWNCGAVAGQEVFHVHLHVIPRYADEPLAGKGIRYWLKQDANSRNRGGSPMEQQRFEAWVERYIGAWNSNDPEEIGGLFTEGARYYTEPDTEPWRGREAIVEGWLGRKDEPGDFAFRYEILATTGDVGVVRGWTRYPARRQLFSNLWVIRLDAEGRCDEFTEWWVQHDE